MAINNRRRLLLLSIFKTLIGSVVQLFSKKFTAQPIKKIIGNTQAITDETYKSGLITPYDTIKTNQIIPDNLINLTTSSSVVPTTNTVGSYISKWLTVENRVGHKVYARIIPSDNRLRLVWYKNNSSGYDFVTGQLLDGISSIPSMLDGIYTITQDMVWTDGYAQLYYFVFNGMPTGSHTLTLQLTDLTELYGEGSEPTNLVTLKAQHPELSRANPYGYRLIGAGEHEDRNYLTTNDGTIIPLSAPLYKVGNVADTVRTNVGTTTKFTKIDLSTLDWEFYSSDSTCFHYATFQGVPVGANGIAERYGRGFTRGSWYVNNENQIRVYDLQANSPTGILVVETETPTQTLFPSPYKLSSLTSVTDGLKQLTLFEVRDEYVKHLENVQNVEYRGKNLFDIDNASFGSNFSNIEDGKIRTKRYIDAIVNLPTKQGVKYTLSFKTNSSYGNSQGLRCSVYDGKGTPYGSDTKTRLYIRFAFTANAETQESLTFTALSDWISIQSIRDYLYDIMLTEGSTATPYEPYFEPTILENIDLKSAGSVRDYIEVTRSNVIRHDLCNEASLGDLNYSKQAVSVQGKYRFISNDLTDIQLNLSSGTVPNIISNKFTAVDPNHLYSGSEGITTNETTSTLMLYSDDYNDLTVEQVKTLLNGAKIVYARSSEIVTDITSTTIGQKLLNLHTTKEATNIITVDNNGQVVVKYKP